MRRMTASVLPGRAQARVSQLTGLDPSMLNEGVGVMPADADERPDP